MYLTTAVTQEQHSVGKNFMLTFPKSSRMQWHQSVLGLIKKWSFKIIFKKNYQKPVKLQSMEIQKILKTKLHPFTLKDSTYKELIT